MMGGVCAEPSGHPRKNIQRSDSDRVTPRYIPIGGLCGAEWSFLLVPFCYPRGEEAVHILDVSDQQCSNPRVIQ